MNFSFFMLFYPISLKSFYYIIHVCSYFLSTFVISKNIITKTMKKFLYILLAMLPLFASAKDDDQKKQDNYNPKYLAGAVTLTDGKVVFEQKVNVPSLSQNDIYEKLLNWANKRFQPEKGMHSRVVYTNKESGQIAAMSEEYIVFSSTALALDRTRIYYQFSMFVSEGQFTLQMNRIRYWYDENRDGGEKYTAEEWIIDEMGLTKKGTKLAPICGKFRRETIDLKDQLFKEATEAVSLQSIAVAQNASTPTQANTQINTVTQATTNVQPVVSQQVAVAVQPTARKKELVEISLNQLPANLNEIAASGRITITAGEEEIEVKSEAWGGFGKLLNKDVTYTLIDKSRMAISLIMEHSDSYKISFYQAGNTEPIVVIDCRKSMKQDLTSEELKSLNQQVDTNKKYTMYIGAITRCMMR